jgi:CMP-N-acetylneuraminic acid synthetase
MLKYAIIPARSGSKGIPNKNIYKIDSKHLIGYSIDFAKKLGVDRIFCSTDSKEYAKIAEQYGAEVPFLRSEKASHDKAMEEDILEDLYDKFDAFNILYPDLFVWLRPTFLFRDVTKVKECIQLLIDNPSLDSCRTVIEAESRLYGIKDKILIPNFDDHGKSMIRRQDVIKGYKVYSTDVFRGNPKNVSSQFLGKNVGAVIVDKICGLDIDDLIDLIMVESLIKYNKNLIANYI